MYQDLPRLLCRQMHIPAGEMCRLPRIFAPLKRNGEKTTARAFDVERLLYAKILGKRPSFAMLALRSSDRAFVGRVEIDFLQCGQCSHKGPFQS